MSWGWRWIMEFFNEETKGVCHLSTDKSYATKELANSAGREMNTHMDSGAKGLPRSSCGKQEVVLSDDPEYEWEKTILPRFRRN